MNSKWTQTWKKLLIWASGYLSFIAFALVGGYAILKGDDDLKKTAKRVFVITLIFTAASMFLSLFSSIGSMFDGWYSSPANDAYGILASVRTIAQIIVYAIGGITTLMSAEKHDQPTAEEVVDDAE